MIETQTLTWITAYECEHCHTKYKDRLKCKQCEESHATELKIIRRKFVPVTNNRNGFPVWVQIENEKGENRKYILAK